MVPRVQGDWHHGVWCGEDALGRRQSDRNAPSDPAQLVFYHFARGFKRGATVPLRSGFRSNIYDLSGFGGTPCTRLHRVRCYRLCNYMYSPMRSSRSLTETHTPNPDPETQSSKWRVHRKEFINRRKNKIRTVRTIRTMRTIYYTSKQL